MEGDGEDRHGIRLRDCGATVLKLRAFSPLLDANQPLILILRVLKSDAADVSSRMPRLRRQNKREST